MEINTNLNVLHLGTQKQQSAAGHAYMPGRNQSAADTQAANRSGQERKTMVERSQDELEDIVDKMQETVKIMQRDLNFSIHDNTGMTVVKVMDASSGEVIRQMPTEDALVLAERLDEMRSLLFEARA